MTEKSDATLFFHKVAEKSDSNSFPSQGGGKKIWQPLLVFFSLINFKRCLENEKKYHTYLTLFSSPDSKFLGKFVIYAAFFSALRTWKGLVNDNYAGNFSSLK